MELKKAVRCWLLAAFAATVTAAASACYYEMMDDGWMFKLRVQKDCTTLAL